MKISLDLELLRSELKSDLLLLIEALEEEKGRACADSFICFLFNYKVSEICRLTKQSRFRVNRQIKQACAFVKDTIGEHDLDLNQEIYQVLSL